MLVMNMHSRGELRIDPGQLGTDAFSGELELVVPYTDPNLTRTLLRKAVALTAGLQARPSPLCVARRRRPRLWARPLPAPAPPPGPLPGFSPRPPPTPLCRGPRPGGGRPGEKCAPVS